MSSPRSRMGQDKVERAAEMIWSAWIGNELLDELPGGLRPADASQGFAIQDALEYIVGDRTGWKVAATSAAGQDHIGVGGPLAGRLYSRFIVAEGAVLDTRHLHMAVIEPELAFRMRGGLVGKRVFSRVEVEEAVDSVFLAIEVPDSRFRQFKNAGEPSLLADNACSGRWVLGPQVVRWRQFDLAAQEVTVSLDGASAAKGRGSNVLGHPLDALTWLVNEVTARGSLVRAGEFVSTGTTTAPVPIQAGSVVSATFPGMGGIRVRFAP